MLQILSGFEHGVGPPAVVDTAEGQGFQAIGTAPLIDTGTVKYGSRSMKIPAANGTSSAAWDNSAATWALGRSYFIRTPIWIGSGTVPSLIDILSLWTASAGLVTVYLTATGALAFYYNPTFALQGTSAVLSRNAWHTLEISIFMPAAGNGTMEARIDGTQFAVNNAIAHGGAALRQVRAGRTGGTAAGVDLFYDHVVMADDQGSANNTWLGVDGGVVMQRPTADNGTRVGWTGGAGGTTNLWDALNNVPSVGVTDPGTNTSQIRDAAASATDNYDAVLQSLRAAGVPVGAVVNAVQSIGIFGATGVINTSLQLTSNPVEGAETVVAAQAAGGAPGTYPSNWITRRGPAIDNPTVAPSSPSVLRIGKRTASSVAIAGSAGAYVLFTPKANKMFWHNGTSFVQKPISWHNGSAFVQDPIVNL